MTTSPTGPGPRDVWAPPSTPRRPPGAFAVPVPQGPPDALEPRSYPQLLRGPCHRAWRPLVSIAVMLGAVVVLVLVLSVVSVVWMLAAGVDVSVLEDPATLASPGMLLANNLLLASLIPAAVLAIWVGHGWRPRWVASVAGRIRWRWLLVAGAVALAVQVVASAVLFAVGGMPEGEGQQVLLLLGIVLLTTPLQAAGEEYLFRGWLAQTIGSWFRGALVAAVVPALIGGLLFAAAHGGQNLWLFLDRLAFGLVASYLTWRTGGLEAAIGAHAVNNVVVFVPVVLTGTLADSLLVSDAPWEMVVLDVVVMLVVAALVVLLARRLRIARQHDPALQPLGPRPQAVLAGPGGYR